MPVLARPLDLLEASPLEWLWRGRLAVGKLAILDGDPGLGKSLVTLDLCARLSTGRPFPDENAGPGPCNSLVINGEDSTQDTVRPRLLALGANLERVFVLQTEEGPTGEPLRLPEQANLLEAAVIEARPRLVVIDPLMAFLDASVVTGSDQSVRRALRSLACIGEKHRCVLLLVRHRNKTAGRRSVYRGGGSIGFIGACRSAWLIAPDPEVGEQYVLAQVKNNLAPPQPGLAYTMVRGQNGPPPLSWLGPSKWSADQLLGEPARPARDAPRNRARDFLEDFLAAGPRTSREIWAAAQKRGLSTRTLDRARKELNIESRQVWLNKQKFNYWRLEGQELPAPFAPDPECAELDQLAELNALYPPATPLDDL